MSSRCTLSKITIGLHLEFVNFVRLFCIVVSFSRLLLHVTNITDKPKFISIEHALAMSFQLRKFGDVIVNFVKPEDVVLDSVELFFKDQYIARSDMWLLKKSITNTCVYLNKKVEFCNVRCQVFEIWSQGARMASGYINEQTKVVFRSASSMVYLFVQVCCICFSSLCLPVNTYLQL